MRLAGSTRVVRFATAVLAVALPVIAAAQDAAAVRQRLLGNWMLVDYVVFDENGGTRPGNYDVGRIMYGESGEMTAHLTRKDRSAYLGYFGPFTIDAARGVVVHHVVGSSLSSWVGSEQVRYYQFLPDGRLTLSLKQGDRITQTLTWERVKQAPVQQPLDVIYVPTPPAVVERMLSLAKVGPHDVVYDLGSGDGRIVISAVRDFGAARGVGIELDPRRIVEARANAAAAGVADRVEFRQEDLFAADLSSATVVTMYLLPALNLRLLPTLRGLRKGTRIVSHNYDFGTAWKANRTEVVENNLVHLWTARGR